ncbi:Uma2 family endonuclease [Iningainema tapete]|uniref:Uma2 family endonuclease n=1 Tax=Iningainema tapete BLCC-T55 TaxID=2748662 RepID=A0A8J7C5W2_9CYAN|nr:Uma2 family endonuclease [Iningainema tapete]MBD2773564.1 Uma2 family endonuclease [Iningainema tapete BLCC-T55]
MTTTPSEKVRWTTADLELFPDDSKRYEIIDGELFVTRAPHWKHQKVCVKIGTQLELWSTQTGLGQVAFAPGVIFTDADNVIPDIVWASNQRLAELLDEAGHLTGAPDLVVEVLSPGVEQERRDKQLKLKLYSAQGVQEYWIFDREKQKIEVYRRENAVLKLAVTLFTKDNLTSPLLPGFSCAVERLFS